MSRLRFAQFVFLLILAHRGNAQEAPPAFSPKDAQKTAIWGAALWTPVRQTFKDGNALALKAAKEEAKRDFEKATKGQTIDWVLKLAFVQPDYVAVQDLAHLPGDGGVACDITIGGFASKKPPKGEKPMFGFPVPDEKWILKAKKGDLTRIQGKIAEANHYPDASHQRLSLGFSIEDPKLSPVEKK